MSHDHPHEHPHPHAHGKGDLPAALDSAVPDAELSPQQLGRRLPAARRSARRRSGGRRVLGPLARPPRPEARCRAVAPHGGRLAGSPATTTSTPSTARTGSTGSRPGRARHRVRPGLDGHHRPRQRRAREVRRGPVNPDIVADPPGGPGPWSSRVWSGTSRPPSTARSSCTRAQRGRRPQAVRADLRRLGACRHGTRNTSTPQNESAASAGIVPRQRSSRAGPRTPCSWPTTRPAGASTRRTRSATGATPPRWIAIGMEGAPGHQAAGITAPYGLGCGRGFYDNCPSAPQLPRLPAGELPHLGRLRLDDRDRRRVLGRLLAEGKSVVDHRELGLATSVYLDQVSRGPGSDFADSGPLPRPGALHLRPRPLRRRTTSGPGCYSRTHVGAAQVLLRRGGWKVFGPAGSGWTMAGLLDSARRPESGLPEPGTRMASTLGVGAAAVPAGFAGSKLVISSSKPAVACPNWGQFVAATGEEST